MQAFGALGAPPPDPRASGGWGLPPDPENSPPLRISGYAPVSAGFHLKSRKKVFHFWEDLFLVFT